MVGVNFASISFNIAGVDGSLTTMNSVPIVDLKVAKLTRSRETLPLGGRAANKVAGVKPAAKASVEQPIRKFRRFVMMKMINLLYFKRR